MGFLQELKQQRWDDHRYYHHNRINQSLHLFSACCFLVSYALVFESPVIAAFCGWVLAMTSRQVGHFFFEPKGFDAPNQVTHEYKEEIKVGYNLNRKVVLLTIWALIPIVLVINPSLFGWITPHDSTAAYIYNVSVLWIWLGMAAIAFRSIQLFFLSGITTGLAWATKILTDPFHDIWLYHKAPIRALKGDLYDPIVGESIDEHDPQHA
ncbi:MAG: hypothetical protein RQ729_11450 [Wenzhouxiangellaceae bacterium]|nr:hypothetical protein [Wenzhouxiangellaceae bacterium]